MTLLEKAKVVLLATWLGKFSPFARSEKETHDFLGISSIYALLFRKVFLLVEGNVFFSVNSAVLLSKDSETFAKSHVHHKIPQSFYIPHGTRYRFRLTSYGNSFNFLHLREWFGKLTPFMLKGKAFSGVNVNCSILSWSWCTESWQKNRF